jgi:hypothetical protein
MDEQNLKIIEEKKKKQKQKEKKKEVTSTWN